MVRARALKAVAGLELAEVIRSKWLMLSSAVYVLIASIFLLAGLSESSVLGFTGMGRVLFSFSHMLLLLLPLLAVTSTGLVVNRSRDDGTFELLFSQPLSRAEYFVAVSLVRFGALLAPLVILFVVLAFLGWVAWGQAVPWAFLGRSLVVCAALLTAFAGVGLAVSVCIRNQARALVVLLVVWLAGVALIDFGLIGLMFQWRLNAQSVFVLASLNPVEAARMALLSSADPTLANLGPVGFYLANRVGQSALFVLGTLWPPVAGALVWLFARNRFTWEDLL